MGELYDRILDMNNLYSAYIECQKEVSWKCSVQRYGANVLANLCSLRRSLETHTYRQKPFFEFDLNERGKMRHIKALDISDRVLQRALCDYVLNPVIRKHIIYDNGASVKGRGIGFARKRIKVHLQRYYRKHGNNGYALLIDFHKYFDSIPHDKVIRKLSEIIQDGEVMGLVEYLLSTFGNGKSVGIGAQISQSVGVFYPTEIDNWCKTVMGCKYYERYNDDTVILHESREFLVRLLDGYKRLAAKLGLVVNEFKTRIVPLRKGFSIMKMRYLLSDTGKITVIPNKDGIKRERQRIKKLARMELDCERPKGTVREQYRSWRGNIIKYNAYKSVRNMDALYKSILEENHGRERNDGRGEAD